MSRLRFTEVFSQPLTHSEIAQKKARKEKRHREAVKERRSAKEKEESRKRKVGRPKKEQPISLEEDSGSDLRWGGRRGFSRSENPIWMRTGTISHF